MKIVEEDRKVVSSGVAENQHFKIEASAKAFKILSDNLYSNKIRAIVRELSCNALDSHTEAKTDAPFTVHLPTKLDPTFYVEDFGLGLSHNDVMNLYTTYFSSTKTGSNDYIGALGLGSKSPFSYTDHFSVISNYDGESRQYIAVLNETGTPTINLMGTIETDEPNGVKVAFAVKDGDFHSFKREAEYVFRFFDPKSYKMNEKFSYDEPKSQFDEFRVFSGYSSKILALQGNVAYPVNVDNLDLTAVLDKLGIKYLPTDSLNIVIDFEIGDLSIAPSREELSYDAPTSAIIIEKIQKFFDTIIANTEQEFSKCKTLFEAQIMAGEMYNTNSRQMRDVLENCVKFNGKSINTHVPIPFTAITNTNTAINYYNKRKYETLSRLPKPSPRRRRWADSNDLRECTAIVDSNFQILVSDLKKGNDQRIVHYLSTVDTAYNFLVLNANELSETFIKQIIALFDGCPITYASKLPSAPRTVRAPSATASELLYHYRTETGTKNPYRLHQASAVGPESNASESRLSAIADVTDERFYVQVSRSLPVSELNGNVGTWHQYMTPSEIDILVEFARYAGFLKQDEKIVAFRKQRATAFGKWNKDDKLKSFFTEFKEYLVAHADEFGGKADLFAAALLGSNKIKPLKTVSSHVERVLSPHMPGIKLGSKPLYNESKLFKQYPMLAHTDSYLYDNGDSTRDKSLIKTITDYMRMVDDNS